MTPMLWAFHHRKSQNEMSGSIGFFLEQVIHEPYQKFLELSEQEIAQTNTRAIVSHAIS